MSARSVSQLLAMPAPPGQDRESWQRDLQILIGWAGGLSRTQIMARPEHVLDEAADRRLRELIARRERGVPIAYLTGRREFWSLELRVTPDTLIPRPETELLVERAVAAIPPDAPLRVVDIGTGCGAIILALAHERPRAELYATDISPAALAVARANADVLAPGRVRFLETAGTDNLPGPFDVVVSNPPYIADTDPCLLGPELAFEPLLALSGGPCGLDILDSLIRGAREQLRAGGRLLLEHGAGQSAAVRAALIKHGYQDIRGSRDLAGHERVLEALWEGVDG